MDTWCKAVLRNAVLARCREVQMQSSPNQNENNFSAASADHLPYQQDITTPRGFEPLRAEPNGFLVHLLSHSDTVSVQSWLEPTTTSCCNRQLNQEGVSGCRLCKYPQRRKQSKRKLLKTRGGNKASVHELWPNLTFLFEDA